MFQESRMLLSRQSFLAQRLQASPLNPLLVRHFRASLRRALASNALEESLQKAATDANHRPQFYNELIRADIYVIPAKPAAGENGGLYLQQWQIPTAAGNTQAVLPFFSSLENLKQFQQSLPEQAPHAKLECRTFFELVNQLPASGTVVLNPGLPYGKGFSGAEIQGLLDGSLLPAEAAEAEEEEDEVIMGQPKVYPTRLVDAMKKVLEEEFRDVVQAAYLCQIFLPSSGEAPHSCIGIEMVSSVDNEEETAQSVVDLLQKVAQDDELVDFVQITNEDSPNDVARYLLNKTEPFFGATAIASKK